MNEAPPNRSLEELLDAFHGFNSMILATPEEIETFTDHIHAHNIPTQTSVDREAGTVTVFKRGWGTMEF